MAVDTKGASNVRPPIGLGTALSRYCGIMLALLRREEEIRRHDPMDSILHLAEPIVLLCLIGSSKVILERFGSPPLGNSPILFYATGFFPKYLFIYISRGMGGSTVRPSNRRLPVERRLDHIIVMAILRCVDYAILGLVLFFIIFLVVTDDAMPKNVVPILQASLLILPLGFGWAIINYVLTKIFWPWKYCIALSYRMLIIFSGVIFLPDLINPSVRYVLSFNPMLHALILFRQGFYPTYTSALLDINYLIGWGVCSVLIGLALERVTRRAER